MERNQKLHTAKTAEERLKTNLCQDCNRDCTMCGIRLEKENLLDWKI